jgi:lipoprotein NlpI
VKTLGLYLRGTLDEKDLLTAAKQKVSEAPVSEQKAQAEYYIGMVHLSKGDKPGAREWLKKCRSAGIKDDDEYYFAVAELARLAAAPPR